MYPARCKLNLTTRGARGDQRISVISSTSSNTTSGIVSDRVHSEDEPDTAPASTECLPRLTEPAPYLAGRVLNGTDNRSVPASPVSIVDGKLRIVLSVAKFKASDNRRSNNITNGEERQSDVIAGQFSEVDGADNTPTSVALRLASSTAMAAEGSQCSSSCSTVVVVNTPAGGPPSRMRRASATSSLELGYSHTAQNSAVSSETASFPGAIYDRCKKTGKYAGEEQKSEMSISIE